MEIIGKFLKILFTKKKCVLRDAQTTIAESIHPKSIFTSVIAAYGSDTLYSASNFSQSKLIYLVMDVYKGKPEPFEYLRCSQTTSEEELRIFMKRVLQHPRLYIVLHVNCLPHFLQEVNEH